MTSQGESSPSAPSEPTEPVRALIATSETPKRMPAAVPSMTPWCSCEPSFGERTSTAPTASSADSKATMAASE